MSKGLYFIHILVLLALQLFLFDNVQFTSLLYINIYILAIIIAPDDISDTLVMCIALLLGGIVDWCNNTMGIHVAAAVLTAYLRPTILRSLATNQNNTLSNFLHSGNISAFFRYIAIMTSIFYVALIFLEVFSFRGFSKTLLRILCSTLTSSVLMILYYYIAIRPVRHE